MAKKDGLDDRQDPEKDKKRQEMYASERKFSTLLDKRNEFNAEARTVADERDIIHKKKSQMIKEMKSLKATKNAIYDEMNLHRIRRDEMQNRAKDILGIKRTKAGKIKRDLLSQIEELKAEIRLLEMRQQTIPVSLKKEKEIVDSIHDKSVLLAEIQAKRPEQDQLREEVSMAGKEVKELFAEADAEHAKVVELSSKARDINDTIRNMVDEIAYLMHEGNKKHEEFLKIKEKANEMHNKATEMREKVISIKQEFRTERTEAKRQISDHNKEVRQKLLNEKEIDKKTDSALDQLKKGGKIRLV